MSGWLSLYSLASANRKSSPYVVVNEPELSEEMGIRTLRRSVTHRQGKRRFSQRVLLCSPELRNRYELFMSETIVLWLLEFTSFPTVRRRKALCVPARTCGGFTKHSRNTYEQP